MIAYVFWHRSRAAGQDGAYEQRLAGFHAALAAERPPGFNASASARVEVPWLSGPGYEDWYLVDDWAAIGTLDAAALDARRRVPHDEVATAAGEGTGAIYALRAGEPDLDATAAAWLDKPLGTPYERFRTGLLGAGAAVWERQLVLGPAPEFCVLDPVEVPSGAERIAREIVFPV